jgi:tetratricopeptide (TPR) repeat protein
MDELKRRESEVLARLRAHPTRIADYCALADIEIQLGDQPRALLAIQEAARLSPTDPALAVRAAELHNMRADWRRAGLEYERSLRLGLRDARVLAALLLAQLSDRSVSAAKRSAARLLNEFPQAPAAWLAVAALRKATGDLSGALDAYRRTVALDDLQGAAWFGLIELLSPAQRLEHRGHLEALAFREVAPHERCNLHFALARIADGERDFERAFAAYCRANAAAAAHLQAQGLTYRADLLKPPPMQAAPQSFDAVPTVPIFIVGMPRSGSTLIEQMLSNHPDVGSAGELTALSDAYDDYLGGARLADLRAGYAGRLLQLGCHRRFVTDKFPGNFRLLEFARYLFPEAPIIHCRRHPMAVGWSIFSTNLTLHAPYHTSLRHIGHFYARYEQLMTHWHRSIEFLEVDYERLLDDPASTVGAMLDHCGLERCENCLRPETNDNPVTTASAAQVRRPLYASALTHWRNYEPWLQPLREALESAHDER